MKNSHILKLGLINFVAMIYSGFVGDYMLLLVTTIIVIISITSYRINN